MATFFRKTGLKCNFEWQKLRMGWLEQRGNFVLRVVSLELLIRLAQKLAKKISVILFST